MNAHQFRPARSVDFIKARRWRITTLLPQPTKKVLDVVGAYEHFAAGRNSNTSRGSPTTRAMDFKEHIWLKYTNGGGKAGLCNEELTQPHTTNAYTNHNTHTHSPGRGHSPEHSTWGHPYVGMKKEYKHAHIRTHPRFARPTSILQPACPKSPAAEQQAPLVRQIVVRLPCTCDCCRLHCGTPLWLPMVVFCLTGPALSHASHQARLPMTAPQLASSCRPRSWQCAVGRVPLAVGPLAVERTVLPDSISIGLPGARLCAGEPSYCTTNPDVHSEMPSSSVSLWMLLSVDDPAVVPDRLPCVPHLDDSRRSRRTLLLDYFAYSVIALLVTTSAQASIGGLLGQIVVIGVLASIFGARRRQLAHRPEVIIEPTLDPHIPYSSNPLIFEPRHRKTRSSLFLERRVVKYLCWTSATVNPYEGFIDKW